MSTHVVRDGDYERTLMATVAEFPERFSKPIQKLDDALAEPLSAAKRKPFANPCPTILRRPRGYEDPVASAKKFSAMLDRIREGWGLAPLGGRLL